FHARLQVGPSQIPEIGGSQAVKRVEKLGAPSRSQSRHCKMLVCQAEQAIAALFVFMQHANQACQIGGKLEVYALHFGVGDHADLRGSDSRVKRLEFVELDRQIG